MATNIPSLAPVTILSQDAPRIVRVLGGNPGKFTLQGTNTYLIGPHSGPYTLVDTGHGEPAWYEELSSHLSSAPSSGYGRPSINRVLLTHWHPDHILGIPSLLSHSALKSSPPAIHKNQPKYLGYPPNSERGTELAASGDLAHESWQDIADGQEFDVGEGWMLRGVHSPGHAIDHMCFALVNSRGDVKGLFTGDNVLGHGTAVFEDLGTYMRTLKNMRAVLPSSSEHVPLYPGHGDVVQDGQAKLDEYYEHRLLRERQVLDTLKKENAGNGLSSMGIVKVVYADVPEILHLAAEGGVRQVLKKLEGEGRVASRETGPNREEIWLYTEGDAGAGRL